ncbi:MAG: UDP-N-acetylmuramate dehydrogenase [Holosporales bacterium]|jgi:UDP-N-acetylmuramate dehydrogenase|nr:UDP-N-acetylmuramate dehydrogenase [Holosporales bacterium]
MLHNLPEVRGDYLIDYPIGESSFLKVGGKCDVLFYPKDKEDLAGFLRNRPSGLQVTVIGNTSNTIILDGGIRGCVINLSKYMNRIEILVEEAVVDAGAQLSQFINKSVERSLSSCEKLCGIPGTIGGAIAMNAGVPGFEIANAFIAALFLDYDGNESFITNSMLNMQYRNGNIPAGLIATTTMFRANRASKKALEATIMNATAKRVDTQPTRCATCGSTFKNPPEKKAWALIKEAGCDTLSVGGAAVSSKHCNFLINTGCAKASDFVELITIIKKRVLEETGVLLEEEIKVIGER